MTASLTTTAAPPSRRRDLIGRYLMALNAVLTFAVFVGGLFLLAAATDDRLMVEGWRTFGYAVFGAMWALLALRPRSVPGIWELVIFHKVAMSSWALLILHTEEGRLAAITDSFIAATTIFAYVACRGWQSWRLFRTGHPAPAEIG